MFGRSGCPFERIMSPKPLKIVRSTARTSADAHAPNRDEFPLEGMREAVAVNRGSPHPLKLEASGSVTKETIRAIALTGVDYVSVGGITKHVHAVDLSMRFEWQD